MFHIKPLPYTDVNEKIQVVYDDIASTLEIQNVPVFFQLMANFEEYLIYIWPQIKKNIQDSQFKKLSQQIKEFTESSLNEVYEPENAILKYISNNLNSEVSRSLIESDISKVIVLNSDLSLIFISLREAVKGWAVGAKKLEDLQHHMNGYTYKPKSSDPVRHVKDMFFEEFSMGRINSQLANAGNELEISLYSKFLTLLLTEMEELVKKKEYLYKRVQLEENILDKIDQFPHIIDSSYSKVSRFAYKYPYFDELLYMLSETFPTLVVSKLTTSVLGDILLRKIHQ